MQLAVSMLAGLVVGVCVFLLTRKRPRVAAWTAVVMGLMGSLLFVGTMNGWFLPELGRLGAIGIGILSGIATAVAAGCLIRGERRPVNWLAMAVAAPPVLFLIIFAAAEVLGSSH